MSELAPWWTNAHMTNAQIRKYIKDMKNAEKIAKQKLKEAEANWEFEKDEFELKELEKKLDNL